MITQGLTTQQVVEFKKKFGENSLPNKEKTTWFSIVLEQLKSPLIYTLIPISLISLLFQEYFDAGLIAGVIVVDVIMGFFQEYSAKKTLSALTKILQPKTIVIRDGTRHEIAAKDLVPGDLVILSAGDKIPADGTCTPRGMNFLVHEAILTGEEEAITKNTGDKLFMGTTVLAGSALMNVTAIGIKTEIGKIGKSLVEIKEEKTPIQRKLETFAKHVLVMILLVCLFIFLFGILNHEPLFTMFKMAVILAIAATPQSLPIAITTILAIGTRRILKKHGLVKKLLSIETLGSTSVICMDKTGTLTQGIMQVATTDFVDPEKTFLALMLTNTQKNNLEVALWHEVKKQKFFDPKTILDTTTLVYEEPFDSEKKYSLVVRTIDGQNQTFVVGAPEILLSFCTMDATQKIALLTKMASWADDGLRLVGAIYKKTAQHKEKKDFIWLGLVGITDPIRKEAHHTLETAQQAGIAVKIVTGDYQKTAARVAKNLGFVLSPHNMIDGPELEEITEKELASRIDTIVLFSRVTPHQKQKIVHVLQERGEIVAMTGDGVNDAPALKKADIGIAMDNACEVAKEAADLILLDNNFKTIIAACEEGRLIFCNIKKTVGYVLSNSFAEVVLVFGAVLLRLPAPLLVGQILWINLICDGPPDLMLAFEPKENDLMTLKPSELKKEEILSRFTKFLILIISIIAGTSALILFWFFGIKSGNLTLGRTLAFANLGCISMVYIFSYKNLKRSLFKTENFFKNTYMLLGVGYGFMLLFSAIYIPFFNKILGTVPLAPFYWILIFGIALFATLVIEVAKKAHRKKKFA